MRLLLSCAMPSLQRGLLTGLASPLARAPVNNRQLTYIGGDISPGRQVPPSRASRYDATNNDSAYLVLIHFACLRVCVAANIRTCAVSWQNNNDAFALTATMTRGVIREIYRRDAVTRERR